MATGSVTVTIKKSLTSGANLDRVDTDAAPSAGQVLAGTIVSDVAAASAAQVAAVAAAATSTTNQATVAANVATLVADGATPTQAHVNTLNTNWAALNTSLNAETALGTAVTNALATVTIDAASIPAGDVTIVFNAATVVSINALKAALDRALQIVRGSSILTP